MKTTNTIQDSKFSRGPEAGANAAERQFRSTTPAARRRCCAAQISGSRGRSTLPWRLGAWVICLFALTAQAQYAIDWSKIAGGGGTSTGGVYSVSGTIGQPDAGVTLTSGVYSLTGGFWSLYAVQTSGAPLLAITQAGNQAIVSWDSSVTGWTLQTNRTLATGTWGNYTGAVVNNRVTKSPPAGNLFFRLKQP